MEIKGTAVRCIPDYIKREYPKHYQLWLDALPTGSKEIMSGYILLNKWYPLQDALVIPLKITSWLFHDNNVSRTARLLGKYSAELAFSNVLGYFMKLSTPAFIVERTSKILNAYISPSDISVVFSCKNTICVHSNHITDIDETIEYYFAGFIEKSLELSGCKKMNFEITQTLTNNIKYTEYIIDWERAEVIHETVLFKKILERG